MRSIFAISGLVLCAVAFQNCSAGFKIAGQTSESNSATSTPGQVIPGTPAPSPVPSPVPAPSPSDTGSSGAGKNTSQAASCQNNTNAQNTMAVQSPCSINLIVNNQKTNPAPFGIGITDQNAQVLPAALPIQVTAPGLKNVEVYVHGAMKVRLTQAGDMGVFTGSLDLSQEPAGPLHILFNGWNAPPGDNSATVALSGVMTLFVKGSRLPMPILPSGAVGMTLKWSDRFTTLSSAPCNPGTGVWPHCQLASAQGSGKTWYENQAGGGDFGDAAFEHSDGKYNPFTILPTGGMVRIRATYDPNYVDPYGYGRKWSAGMLSTGFGSSPPVTTNLPVLTDGYYEARMLVPNASAGNPWSGKAGGTWPAFWQTSINSTDSSGTIELDSVEYYGEDPGYYQVATHAWGNASIPNSSSKGDFIYHQDPQSDLTWDFHRTGLLIQGSGTNNGTVCSYLDDVKMGCQPLPVLANGAAPQWLFMINMAMGAGWPTNPPPSNQYDMFVDYVAAWTK